MVGLFSRALGDIADPDRWVTGAAAAPAAATQSAWHRSLSGPQLALATLIVGLATAVAGLVIYYPAPDELLNQMDEVQAELTQAAESRAAEPATGAAARRSVAKTPAEAGRGRSGAAVADR